MAPTRKRSRSTSPNTEDVSRPVESDSTSSGATPRNRDRVTHNQSERKRSQNQRYQIDRLGSALARAGKVIKRDKNSVLENAVDYIAELEEKLASVSSEGSTQQIVNSSCNGGTNSEIDYKRLLHSSGVAQLVVSTDFTLLDCNDMFCSLARFPRERLVNQSMLSLIPEHERPKSYALLEEMLSECRRKELRNSYITRSSVKNHLVNGENLQLYVTTALLCNSKGEPEHFISTIMKPSAPSDSGSGASSAGLPNLRLGNCSTGEASVTSSSPKFDSIDCVSSFPSGDHQENNLLSVLDDEPAQCFSDFSPVNSVESAGGLGLNTY